jgi:putative ATP-binding cassette transporter
VSIGHRSTLAPLHERHLRLERDGDIHRLTEIRKSAAAE